MSELKVHASLCESERMVHTSQLREAFVIRLKQAAASAAIPDWGLGARLSMITGKTAKAASKWLNGESMPSRASMQQIADALHVRIEWLQYGEGLPFPTAPYQALPKPAHNVNESSNVYPALDPVRKTRTYPLISWIAAGSWAESCDLYLPGDGEDFIESIENAGDCGYWLEVDGESMIPPAGFAFNPGMRILVKPEGFDVISGKLYIAKLLQTGETTFKQYVRDSGIEYLKPLNPGFKTIVMDENIKLIGRVIDARPPRSIF